jgi:aminotransferase
VESDGFEVTVDNLERHLTKRTTGLILNYPNNPTGATLSADKVAEVAEFARSRDLLVYSDETYVDLTYEGRPASIADYEGMQEHVVVLRTFSKTFAMTGWRVGYLAASEDIVRTATVLREHTSTCTNSVSQHAAIAALESGAAAAKKMLDQYRSRRQVVIDEFSDFEYAKLFRPRGTFYGFVNIEACGKPSTDVALLLLRRHAGAVAPGSAFGEAGEGYIRICFACPISEIREGISRIRSGLEELAAEG